MSKNEKLSAKEVAAMCDMTAKNFRKHLRQLNTFADRKEKRYSFTSKQAEKIVATLAADDVEDTEVTA
jgi:phage antirepressor YoqD-like protein